MIQNIKDSFYMELRTRLAALNPDRIVWLGGVQRPAVVVVENEIADTNKPQPNVFYLTWKAVQASGAEALLQLVCEIHYTTAGSDTISYQDRGRTLAQLDDELLAICCPGSTELKDYSQLPPADQGRRIFWTRPELAAADIAAQNITRTASVRVFTFAEVAC